MTYEHESGATFIGLRDWTSERVCFRVGGVILLELDKDGMTYKGRRVEDAGTAHRAFLEFMGMMRQD